MVIGTTKFKEYFKEYKDQYVVIGGVACNLILSDAGLFSRTTHDFDIVIIVESLSESFVKKFWEFIKDGEYEYYYKSDLKPHFYRFSKPKNAEYPEMLEIFSRKPDFELHDAESFLAPLHISDELSSLSAILLDADYYEFLLKGRFEINELPLLKETHLIPFKAKAYLDLSNRKHNGENIDSNDINKHKNDVFRLFQLISPDLRITLNERVKLDMMEFVESMKSVEVDLRSLGYKKADKQQLLSAIRLIYGLDN